VAFAGRSLLYGAVVVGKLAERSLPTSVIESNHEQNNFKCEIQLSTFNCLSCKRLDEIECKEAV